MAVLEEGKLYDLQIRARNPRGEGIGHIEGTPVFVRNGKTRIGKIYKVKITKVYRTFAYAEPINSKEETIGRGSVLG
ncbi:MAG: TRAM domain-containing protein [Candidatus Micrarchaeaceae archaeon]